MGIIKIYRRTYGLLKAHPIKTQMIFGGGIEQFFVRLIVCKVLMLLSIFSSPQSGALALTGDILAQKCIECNENLDILRSLRLGGMAFFLWTPLGTLRDIDLTL